MLSEIKYGNPNLIQQEILHKETFLDSLLAEIINFPPPKASDIIKEEVEELIKMVALTLNNEEAEKRYLVFDHQMIRFFKTRLAETDSPEEKKICKIVDGIMADTSPLLLKVKYHFSRIRPYQAAQHLDLPLFPYPSTSSDSPSYISGHAFQGKVICEVLGNTFPESYGYFQKLGNDISVSRLHLGLNYRSDIDMALFAAEKVLKNAEFKLKYRL